jgi:hypothetical protein
MRKMATVVAVMVLALALCQSAIAAPTQGFMMAAENTSSVTLLDRLLGIFGAIWGGGAPGGGGNNGAIWGGNGPGGGGNNGAIWGGNGPGGGGNNGAIWGGNGPGGGGNNGAVWGCGKGC